MAEDQIIMKERNFSITMNITERIHIDEDGTETKDFIVFAEEKGGEYYEEWGAYKLYPEVCKAIKKILAGSKAKVINYVYDEKYGMKELMEGGN